MLDVGYPGERTTESLHILLVEDDEDDFVLIQDYLQEFRGVEVDLEWKDSYDDGMQAMVENRHDVYLLDYRLGNETGLDLLRTTQEMGCKGPVIVLTGQGDHEIDLAVMEGGAVDYLVKEQVNVEVLERSIRYAIHRKRAELELAEMQRRLADSREEERLSLARELHDGPLQELLGLRFHLGALRNELPEPFTARLDLALGNLQQVADILRSLCGQLRPPALFPFGLSRAIRSHVQQFRVRHPDFRFDLTLDDENGQLDEATRLALYRIFQNAMANILKHANASFIQITLQLEPDSISLRVLDNGVGFRVPANWMDAARHGHYGLLGAAERAESIGGRLVVDSVLGHGTSLNVVVPRHPESADGLSELKVEGIEGLLNG